MRCAAARIWMAAAFLALLLGGCVSEPAGSPPYWSISPSVDDERRLHFVASGDSSSEAAETAADAIINRFSLGAEAQLDSSPVTELRKELVEAMISGSRADSGSGAEADSPADAGSASAAGGESGTRVEVSVADGEAHLGIRVERRGKSRSEGTTVRWLHVSVERDTLDVAELALARSVPGGNPGPLLERRAREKAEDDRLLDALRDYGKAIHETAGTPYAAETSETATRGARELLERIEIEVEQDGIESRLGRPFDSSLIASVVDTKRGEPIAGMPIAMSYQRYDEQENLERDVRYEESAQDGRVTFTPPTPQIEGTYTVSMAPAPFFDPAPTNDVSESVTDLVQRARSNNALLEYRAYSRAAEVPTGVFIVDIDTAGNPTGSLSTQRALLHGLEQRDFQASPVDLGAEQFLRLGERGRLSLVRRRAEGDYGRVVMGTASITEFEESENVSVEVQGDLRAVDLDSGDELYRQRLVQRSRGNTPSGAIAAAFRGLGAKFAHELSRRLP